MAFRGSLREASLPDVLQLLSMGKKSGCLSVTHRHAFGNIYFDRGRISFASIVNRRDRLQVFPEADTFLTDVMQPRLGFLLNQAFALTLLGNHHQLHV